MTVSVYKLSIIGVAVTLLAGCSVIGNMPYVDSLMSRGKTDQTILEGSGGLEACVPESGSPFNFRKDILVVGTVGGTDQARDLPGLSMLTSKRLQTHLESLERFNVYGMHDSTFSNADSSTPSLVRELGREYSSQFVVKLELEDLTVRARKGWLRKVIGGVGQRNVAMKLYVYGTEYGELFHTSRFQDTVHGYVSGHSGNGPTVTTLWFDSDLGSEIDAILKKMSTQINERLACVPFAAKVIAMNGGNIEISAGYLHGVRPGTNLRIHQSKDIMTTNAAQKQAELEGWVTVHAVFPSHSIASVVEDSSETHRPEVGDAVRAW